MSVPAEGTPGGLALSEAAGGAAGEVEQAGMEPTHSLPWPQAGPLTLAELRVLSGSHTTLHQRGDMKPTSPGST